MKDKLVQNKQTGSCLHLMDIHFYIVLIQHLSSGLTVNNKFKHMSRHGEMEGVLVAGDVSTG